MSLDQASRQDAANTLLDCRRNGGQIDSLPQNADGGLSLGDGYAIQALLIDGIGSKKIGYKIGCTGTGARELLGIDHPFYGAMIESGVSASPANLEADQFNMRVIEPEFALRISKDLPAKGSDYTADDIKGAIDAVRPVIEIVNSYYTEWTSVGAPSLGADNGAHGAWVTGPILEDWTSIDFDNHGVSLSVNGAVKDTGSGAAVLTGVFGVTAWLANALIENGLHLKAGEWISTGTTTPVYPASKGDAISADFGSLGEIEITFS